MTFGERLLLHRKRLTLSHEQLAEMGGVKRASQHLYEQNVRVPDLHYLVGLSEHGVDIGVLMFGTPTDQLHRDMTLSAPMAIAAFRAVEEFSRGADEAALSPAERERFFAFLCTTLAAGDTTDDLAELKTHLTHALKR